MEFAPRESMALRAAEDPILTSDSRALTIMDTKTAFSGIFHLGFT
jgi:hypothetical protein